MGRGRIAAFLALLALPAGLLAQAPPPEAKAAGYRVHTFHSVLDRKDIDLGDTRKSGFQWYLGQFFGSAPTAADTLTFNRDGSVTLNGSADRGSTINTAGPAKDGWVGVAFGRGAYFEAVLKFDADAVIRAKGKNGWPAWWSMAIEHLALLPSEQWPGQEAGYAHFIEPDFFEYDVWSFSPHHWYGGAMHDWYGVWKKTNPNGFVDLSNAPGGGTSFGNFQVHTPEGTDFSQYHRFGFLWIPATATSRGSATYFFDGKATNDVVTWAQYTDQPPPPGRADWTFGILDRQHVALIVDTGSCQPMTVRSVDVWQRSTSANLRR